MTAHTLFITNQALLLFRLNVPHLKLLPSEKIATSKATRLNAAAAMEMYSGRCDGASEIGRRPVPDGGVKSSDAPPNGSVIGGCGGSADDTAEKIVLQTGQLTSCPTSSSGICPENVLHW